MLYFLENDAFAKKKKRKKCYKGLNNNINNVKVHTLFILN